MTDQTVGQPAPSASSSPPIPVARTLAPGWGVRPLGSRTAALAALAIILALQWHIMWYEGWWPSILFVNSVTLMLVAALTCATRRLLFSTTVVGALVTVIVLAATAKHRAMEMVLHAYDIFFYLGSWSTVTYLWSDHRAYLIELAVALGLTAAAAWATWRADPTRISRKHAAGAMLALAVTGNVAANWKGERRHTQFYWEDMYLASFYASWVETAETLWRGTLIQAASSQDAPPFHVPNRCNLASKPPHIVLIHEESIVPPSYFPQLSYDRKVDDFFKSDDGGMHKMRVETYGGASWLTEFSILAGVSTHSFGGMRQFVQSLMAGKVRDTLPETLARCGYRNVVFYPMMRNFVSNAKFYTAVGMPEILDMKDQGAATVNERDRFYFNNTLGLMEKHFKSSSKPLFTFIETMSAHSPYTYVWSPEMDVPGGGPGTPPEMHEYLRRLSMTKMDYDWFRAELEKRFPNERFLVVHYGDHHPMATRTLLGSRDNAEAEDVDVLLTPNSIGYRTYYAVSGIRFQPKPLPPIDVLDVPYLGSVILDAARLPLSEAMSERQRLLYACNGAYHDCAKQDQILSFHRRLIDSGLIDAR